VLSRESCVAFLDSTPLRLPSWVVFFSLNDAQPATCALVLVFGLLRIRGDDVGGVVAIAKTAPSGDLGTKKPAMGGCN
jgi:hypothetical protein